jgi:hypothetical protein
LSNFDNSSLAGLDNEPGMTVSQTVRFLNENGYPISLPYFRKITLRSQDSGPPFKWFGGRKLYVPSLTLQWAKERCGATRRGTLAAA